MPSHTINPQRLFLLLLNLKKLGLPNFSKNPFTLLRRLCYLYTTREGNGGSLSLFPLTGLLPRFLSAVSLAQLLRPMRMKKWIFPSTETDSLLWSALLLNPSVRHWAYPQGDRLSPMPVHWYIAVSVVVVHTMRLLVFSWLVQNNPLLPSADSASCRLIRSTMSSIMFGSLGLTTVVRATHHNLQWCANEDSDNRATKMCAYWRMVLIPNFNSYVDVYDLTVASLLFLSDHFHFTLESSRSVDRRLAIKQTKQPEQYNNVIPTRTNDRQSKQAMDNRPPPRKWRLRLGPWITRSTKFQNFFHAVRH